MRKLSDEPNLIEREEHWPSGALKARFTVIVRESGEDERHGEYRSFHENGKPHQAGQYAYGEAIGEWQQWDDEGDEVEADVPESNETPAPNPDAGKPWKLWSIELAVVLALAWLPHLVTGIASLWVSRDMLSEGEFDELVGDGAFDESRLELDPDMFLVSELPMLATYLQVLLPLLYICWRSDLTWKKLGIVKPTLWGLLLLGPLLGAATLLVDAALVRLFEPETSWYYVSVPSTTFTWTVFVVAMILNSFAEEFVWRGFVLQRLRQMSGSTTFALLISTFLFATYHVYQGFGNMWLVFISGLIWGVAVIGTKRIWPAVVAHTVFNITIFTPIGEWLFP